MSRYVHGASSVDPVRRAAQLVQALRYQLAQKDVELRAAHAHAEQLRASLDRYTKPARTWGAGNERLWAATREMEDWSRRNPSRRTVSKRRAEAARMMQEGTA